MVIGMVASVILTGTSCIFLKGVAFCPSAMITVSLVGASMAQWSLSNKILLIRLMFDPILMMVVMTLSSNWQVAYAGMKLSLFSSSVSLDLSSSLMVLLCSI